MQKLSRAESRVFQVPMFLVTVQRFSDIGGLGDEAIVDPGLPVFDDRWAAATTAPPAVPPAARDPANVAFARTR
jgi:hypothetical protein